MTNEVLTQFITDVKPEQKFWALQDTQSEDWVVLDSSQFEQTEAMPLWSTEALAKAHCVDEWADYVPASITLADWLEYWLEDLSTDNIIVGLNWQEDQACFEIELGEFSQALAEIESL